MRNRVGGGVRLRRPGGRREPLIPRASLPRPDGARRARTSSRGCSVSSSSRRRHGRPARPAGRRTALPPTQPWTWTSSCRPCPRRPTTRPSTPARPRPTPTGGSLRGAGPRGVGRLPGRRGPCWVSAEQAWQPVGCSAEGHRSLEQGPETDIPTGSHGGPGSGQPDGRHHTVLPRDAVDAARKI